MKKALSMLVALAMVLTLVVAVAPVTNAAATTLAEVTETVTADKPYVWEWEATADGTLHIDASPEYSGSSANAAYKVNIYADKAQFDANEQPSILKTGSYHTPGDTWFPAVTDYKVGKGNYVVVTLAAQKGYADADGTVSMTVTFTEGGAVEKTESVIAYDTVLAVGQNDLTLSDAAYNTLYLFEPDEIGVYTLSVNTGAIIGYWGAGTYWYENPNSTATSIEREIKQVGQTMLIGIASDDPNVTLTIEKTGESGGIVQIVYVNWENKHTPTKSLAGTPAGKTLTKVNINEAHDAVLGADGFYHLDSAAGPLLYADLISDGFNILSPYGLTGEAGEVATRMRGEYNGEHYEFLGAMQSYASTVNGTDGNYPLTEDLLAFIKGYGTAQGWFMSNLSSFEEISSGEFLEESAWMVCLSYAEGEVAPHDCVKGEDPDIVYPDPDDWTYWDEVYSCELCGKPMETTRWYMIMDQDDTTADVEFTTEIGAGETGNYHVSFAGTVLVMEEGDFTLTIDGEVQTPVDGFYIYEITSYYGTKIQITNNGDAAAEYEIVLVTPLGTAENPDVFIPGNTDVIEFPANSDGYYYNFVATCDGVLSATVTGDGWMFYFTNYGDVDDWYDDVWGDYFTSEDPSKNTGTMAFKAGDLVELFVTTYDPNSWDAPAGTLTVELGMTHGTDGLTLVGPVAPGHTTPGNSEYYACPDCDYMFDAEGNAIDATIPATGHTTAVFVPEVPATEEADGMEEHWYCADCDAYFTDAECTNEVEKDDLVITYIPKTGDMSIAALAVALMAATAGAIVVGKKKEF